jgi:hypothetical protein
VHVRAQRKFATNSSPSSPQRNATDSPLIAASRHFALPDSSPGGTQRLSDGSDSNMRKLVANRLLNTEDFLTYLCLRGEHLVQNIINTTSFTIMHLDQCEFFI